MSNTKIFDITQRIVGETESLVAANRTLSGWWLVFARAVPFPIFYLHVGAGELFRPVRRWALMVSACLILLFVATRYIDISQNAMWLSSSFFMFICMFLVIFSTPSSYAYYGVSSADIGSVVSHLERIGVDNAQVAESIEENMGIISQRLISRIAVFRWGVAVCWAISTLTLNYSTNIILKVMPESWEQHLLDNLFSFIIFAVLSFVAILLIASYKKATDILVKTIEFGLVEIKHKHSVANSSGGQA